MYVFEVIDHEGATRNYVALYKTGSGQLGGATSWATDELCDRPHSRLVRGAVIGDTGDDRSTWWVERGPAKERRNDPAGRQGWGCGCWAWWRRPRPGAPAVVAGPRHQMAKRSGQATDGDPVDLTHVRWSETRPDLRLVRAGREDAGRLDRDLLCDAAKVWRTNNSEFATDMAR